jgi:hypothetical protein
MKPTASVGLASMVQSSIGAAGATSPGVAALAKIVAGATARATALTAVSSMAALAALAAGLYIALTPPRHIPSHAGSPVSAAASLAPRIAAAVPLPSIRAITLAMIDPQTNQPIAGAMVQVRVDNKAQPPAPAYGNGKYVITLPDQFSSLVATVHAPGRVPMRVTFDNSILRGDLPPVWPVPMDVGVAVGGRVVDEAGKPVAGAEVRLETPRNGVATSDQPGPTLDGEVALTTADGTWQLDHVPPMNQIGVGVQDPTNHHASIEQIVSGEELQAKSDELTMPPPVLAHAASEINGIVFDPDGNPLSGAQVVAVAPKSGDMPGDTKTITDAGGRFHLTHVKPEQTEVVAVADKGTPTTVTLREDDAGRSIEIQIKPAVTLEVLLVDVAGKPVDGVLVGVEGNGWHWSKKSKSGGRATWKNAPTDEFVVFANAPLNHLPYAFMQKRVKATDGMVRLVLPAALLISGRVTDAATHEAIPLFRLTYGVSRGALDADDQIDWQPYNARSIANGRYEATITDFADVGGKLKVDADGYEPAVSRLIRGAEGKVTVDFELKRAGDGSTSP